MPKNVFWPIALVIMGCVLLAANLNILPLPFLNFWPLILIIVGLGGLLTSDREEWIAEEKKTTKKKKELITKKIFI